MAEKDEKVPVRIWRKGNPQLKRQIVASVRQQLNKRYEKLEAAMDEMDDRALQEFVWMIREYESKITDAERRARRGF